MLQVQSIGVYVLPERLRSRPNGGQAELGLSAGKCELLEEFADRYCWKLAITPIRLEESWKKVNNESRVANNGAEFVPVLFYCHHLSGLER